MDTKQKFKAIHALARASIMLDYQDKFYVSHDVHMYGDAGLHTEVGIVGRGPMPHDAIEAHWELLTKATHDNPLRKMVGGTERGYVWNGFMWEEVSLPRKSAS
jgi:hypothetical protein